MGNADGVVGVSPSEDPQPKLKAVVNRAMASNRPRHTAQFMFAFVPFLTIVLTPREHVEAFGDMATPA
jgi:hypothetical protein